MDERKFLNKIRKLQESGKSISLTEMENTKLWKQSRILNESLQDDLVDVEDEEGQDISSDEQKDEENAFKDTVTQLIQFEKIKVYKQNVTWSGKLVREKINWVYTLADSIGCYISTDNDDVLQLTDDNLKLIQKIRAYYDTWQEEWSSRLTGGSPSTGEEEVGGF